jgi:hypothetical protein
MLDTSLQQQLEEQGKDELRNFIATRMRKCWDDTQKLPEIPENWDAVDCTIAKLTIDYMFRVLKKAGIKFEE